MQSIFRRYYDYALALGKSEDMELQELQECQELQSGKYIVLMHQHEHPLIITCKICVFYVLTIW